MFACSLRPQLPANSHSPSKDRTARVATTRSVDPHPRPPPTLTSAATAAAFLCGDACAAQKRCSALLAATLGARKTQPPHRRTERSVHRANSQPLQKSIQRRILGHTRQFQSVSQLTLFAEPHLGFAKGPHQTKHCQQLRLVENRSLGSRPHIFPRCSRIQVRRFGPWLADLRSAAGRSRAVEFNVKENPHLDYGYAVTSHSGQGQTADRVLVHMDTEQAGERLVNRRLAYVAVSRGRYDAHLYTNDKGHLAEQLSRDVSHQSAMEPSCASASSAHDIKPSSARSQVHSIPNSVKEFSAS